MNHQTFEITANRVDVVGGTIEPATIVVKHGIIQKIRAADSAEGFILPGFVDSHIHIESSMMLPSQFARTAAVHGTIATVSDPHEIANVCGRDGIELMLRDAASTSFRFHFGAPACVPATAFETAGAVLDAECVEALLADNRIGYLSEVMDFPGVLSRSESVMAKISAAQRLGKPIDGHAPGLKGADVERYFSAGITTDHECVSPAEAVDRIRVGCRVAIREGSAARNFDALQPLIDEYPDACMLCSDDKHPDELLEGHINQLVARAIASGTAPMHAIQAASLNPVRHYHLPVGLLQHGDPADFIVTDNLTKMHIRATYIEGEQVARDGKPLMQVDEPETINAFHAQPITVDALAVPAESNRLKVIEVTDGQLTTHSSVRPAALRAGYAVSNVELDVLKLVVLNRYHKARPAVAFVRGFGLKRGAIASSVAHDSHNVVAVGASDDDLCAAINTVVESQGGLSVCAGSQQDLLPLPVAGLMTTDSCEVVGANTRDWMPRRNGWAVRFARPYTTLSFMALLVIPSLKLSDRGLFDVDRFEFVPLFA